VSPTTGTRLRARNSACEIVVIKGPADGELRCAGVPMEAAAEPAGPPAEGPAVELGKRYVDEAETVEVLCVKPGPGPLSLDDAPLVPKTAKPLPSSD
jgi:hypothetical protein